MLFILFTLYFLGCASFLICHLLAFVVVISCNSAPFISNSCFTSVCFTSCPPTFHSHLLSVVISFTTLLYFCLCSSLIYHVFSSSSNSFSSPNLRCFVPGLFSYCALVSWALFLFSCSWVVGITRWICFQYLHRIQILAVYFLGSQDESIIINFS